MNELRLKAMATQQLQPELYIRGDPAVSCVRVAQVLAKAQREGVDEIGFVTETKTP